MSTSKIAREVLGQETLEELEEDLKKAKERKELDFRCIAGAAIAHHHGNLIWASVVGDIERYERDLNRIAELESKIKRLKRE